MDNRLPMFRPPSRALAAALSCAALAAVSGCGPKAGAVKVVVHFGALVPGCVEVQVSDSGGQTMTAALARSDLAGKARAVVGVQPGKGWSSVLSLEVRAREASCTGNVLQRETHGVTVQEGQVTTWEVTLTIPDGDGDGYAPASVGGTDCEDTLAARNPGALEDCAGGGDLNCNTLTRCADPACAGTACDDGDACTRGDACQSGACRGAAPTCKTPPGECFDAGGSCGADGGCSYGVLLGKGCTASGDAGLCYSDGTCGTGEAFCANGADDDGDTLVDCQDPDCGGQACSDGQLCTLNDTCAGASCTGTPNPCASPPAGQCWQDAGTCAAATGACTYTPAPGRACSDGNGCTGPDLCLADAGCGSGATKVCNTPPGSCWSDAGVCEPADGGCVYTPRGTSTVCSDAVACTHTDRCDGSGACAGVAYGCSPGVCQTGAACLGDGGCTSSPATGTPCGDGGICNLGVCQAPDFPFLPDNFTPQPSGPNRTVVLDCHGTYDTSPSGGGFNPSSCPSTKPIATVLGAGTADERVLLEMKTLEITDAGSLTFVGSRPVILAVYGDAIVQGALRANSVRGVRYGAGADPADCGSRTGGDGSDNGGQGGGGAGAGFRTDGGWGGGGNSGAASRGAPGVFAALGPSPLRGGCKGGWGSSSSTPSDGGSGGGALQLSVAGTLRVGAVVTASGMGGKGGTGGSDPGGGGGGSGGMLIVQAYVVELRSGARLTCNGGGGGGGAQGSTAGDGEDGRVDTANAAAGGSSEAGGGQGGDGAAGSSSPQDGSDASKGGGGGGGAAGRIFLHHFSTATACVNNASVISPPALKLNCP